MDKNSKSKRILGLIKGTLRNTWGSIKPITKIIPNKKKEQETKRIKIDEDDYEL